MAFQEIIPAAGLLLSIYALTISRRNPRRALCDIRKNISCTKAFTSKYSTTFGIHNAIWGIVFYSYLLIIWQLPVHELFTLIPAALAVLKSLQLAYISYIKMKNFCLICTLTYLINIAILAL